jgi:transposase
MLGLTELVTSIDGLSAVGAAVILAETEDLSRFASARSVVKHAVLNPDRSRPGRQDQGRFTITQVVLVGTGAC